MPSAPDWRSASAYFYLHELNAAEFAAEFLRLNPASTRLPHCRQPPVPWAVNNLAQPLGSHNARGHMCLYGRPKLMHALIWHQSGGEPWSVSVAGERQPQVYRSALEAVRETQTAHPQRVPIRVGLTGLGAESTSATGAMFTPCLNISMAARQIAQLVQRCKANPFFKADPVRCAIAAYHGSWDRPDNKFADVVAMSAVNGDAPNFDMTGNTDVGSGQLTPDVRGARQRASTVARCSSRTAARLVECIVSAEIEAVRPRFDEHQLEHSGCRSAARVERIECTSDDRGNA